MRSASDKIWVSGTHRQGDASSGRRGRYFTAVFAVAATLWVSPAVTAGSCRIGEGGGRLEAHLTM
jgi:hypothetical protein